MWTEQEELDLISLYPNHTNKELALLLNKTEGQIRGKKERLGLNSKYNVLSDDDLSKIYKWYVEHDGVLCINELASDIRRSPQTISRAARRMGLTNSSRPSSEDAINKLKESIAIYRKTEYYINNIKPKQKEILSYYAKHNHPRGMMGKNHSEETRMRMSNSHKDIWANMSENERTKIISNMKNGLIKAGGYRSRDTTYSRGNGGYREDIGIYVRSSWEANVARWLDYMSLRWEYEPFRFVYDEENKYGIKSYCPDFYLPDENTWIEVKGWMDDKSIQRIMLFKEYYPESFDRLIIIEEQQYNSLLKNFKEFVCFE